MDIDRTIGSQNPGQKANDRFCHGLRQMQGFRCHAVEIAFENHAVAMHHQEGIAIAFAKKAINGDGRAVLSLEPDVSEVFRGFIKHARRPEAAKHIDGRNEAAHILESPAVERRKIPVRKRRALFRRRRKSLHDPQLPGGLGHCRFNLSGVGHGHSFSGGWRRAGVPARRVSGLLLQLGPDLVVQIDNVSCGQGVTKSGAGALAGITISGAESISGSMNLSLPRMPLA
jgi:hypothetical protein